MLEPWHDDPYHPTNGQLYILLLLIVSMIPISIVLSGMEKARCFWGRMIDFYAGFAH